MAALIHPTAVVDERATLAEDVVVGAYSVIGAEVSIGAGTRIGPHCSIQGPTRIGEGNHIHGHAAIGGDPQDKKYAGERAELLIGDGNVIREFVTINRGTGGGGGVTSLGNRNWLLAYVHIAHDCVVGDDCVFSNNATLAGHVTIGNQVILSGFVGVHQFCRIGDHAFIGMGAFVNGDVPPFVMVAQDKYARARGINSEGLKRRGYDARRIQLIRRAYRALYLGEARLEEAKAELAEIARDSDDVRQLLDFIEASERGLLR
ncbi:MAG: acyl-ACP--UDP-N-acetylglucosamine O-acyltransferase [Pseudoxanthomonas suwonensis]|nr:acyl-ACP--UDP-N-acetylglucosamine O-acyltransferase [Pseudoxanthomonas suwonensis]